MRFEEVLRYSKDERLYRLFRIVWDGRWSFDGRGEYAGVISPARKLSVAIRMRPCPWPLRIRFVKSYGGNFG
jgi:hypothetical protein